MAGESILVVEDEANIARILTMYLEREGYRVVVARDGEQGLEQFHLEHPDLIILDLLLPKLDGLEVCRRIRRQSFVPLLMLTAKKDETDKIVGLELGADDYMTKPFSPREMVTRVRAILRRARQTSAPPASEGVMEFGELRIDAPKRSVRVGNRSVLLTAKEFDLLHVLASSPGKVFSRDALLNQVWGYDYYGDARTVDVHIGTLRKKLEPQPSSPRWVKTVWGVGYKFDESVAEVAPGLEG
ncbi:MAG: response regulator transcription factor [Chloroflexi bacterium]|nr:response regulator transcription factor [Chloroflexota bacterium]